MMWGRERRVCTRHEGPDDDGERCLCRMSTRIAMGSGHAPRHVARQCSCAWNWGKMAHTASTWLTGRKLYAGTDRQEAENYTPPDRYGSA